MDIKIYLKIEYPTCHNLKFYNHASLKIAVLWVHTPFSNTLHLFWEANHLQPDACFFDCCKTRTVEKAT
jgi:hypothetical protein